jgi:hypothetical protein
MSRSAAIPTGDDLICQLAARRGMRAIPSPVSWYVDTFGQWPSYEALLYEVHEVPRDSDPRVFFAPTADDVTAGRRIPRPAHRALAELVRAGHFRLILTTNFDRLIETALAEAGMAVTVASLPDDMACPRSGSPHVLKLHGDYADLAPKMLPRRQLHYASAKIRAVLAEVFATHHVLACGWSAAWDTALAEALAAGSAELSVHWLTTGELSAAARTIVRRRTATVLTIEGADSFFMELASHLLFVPRG